MYTLKNISSKPLHLLSIGKTIPAGAKWKVENLHDPAISSAIQAGFIKVIPKGGELKQKTKQKTKQNLNISFEDALSLFITVDDALFFEKHIRLLNCTPDDVVKMSALDVNRISPGFWEVIEDLSDCWQYILSTPEELVNKNGTIRIPSKYEGFLNDYDGF